jgi:hypothetical protein
VFYVIAGMLLIIGLCQRSLGILFFASSMSMFITGSVGFSVEKFERFILVIFASSTIGLFAGQGRTLYQGYLSYGWWVALVALIMSVITAFSLIILSFYIAPLPTITDNKM